MKCQECDEVRAEYEDPRDPPIEEGVCLCLECYRAALEEELVNLEDAVELLADELNSLPKRRKASKR